MVGHPCRQLAAEDAAKEAENRDPLLEDPWLTPVSRLRGHIDQDGGEYVTTQQALDALDAPLHARNTTVFQRLTQLMQAHGWEACRISGISGSVDTRVRGYQRKTSKLQVSEEFPGKIDTTTPYVLGRLDGRWALARSVRALVAERDALKDKLDGNSIRQTDAPQGEVRNF
jgi:hypothetical protein